MGVQWSMEIAGHELTVHSVYRDGTPKMAQRFVSDGRHLSYVSKSGKFFSTRCDTFTRRYGRRWHGHVKLVRDAITLGVLPKDCVETVLKAEERRQEKHARGCAAEIVLDNYKRAGIHLTDRQIRALRAAKRGQRRDL